MNFLFLLVLFLLNNCSYCQSTRIVSWYVGDDFNDPLFPLHEFNWKYYTHIKYDTPTVFENGTAICEDKNNKTTIITNLAHKFGTKIQWGLGFNFNPAQLDFIVIQNYLNSIGRAVKDCNIDGIEVDYEWHNNNWGKIGFIPHSLSNIYSQFLKDIKIAIGQEKIVSADVSGWGVYVLGLNPWINVSMLNQGDFDFINVMSYYYSSNGDLFRWKKDIDLFKNTWGIDPLRVNIGIPYFSVNKSYFKTNNQPSWKTLSEFCPNIAPKSNVCNGILFTGKELNRQIGLLIKESGFGGAFPWAANYDAIYNNNSLITWLYNGLKFT